MSGFWRWGSRWAIVAFLDLLSVPIPNPQDMLEFPAQELRKYFKMGDHVKVIAGRFEGDTGLIVRVEENFVILFSDLTMHEVSGGLGSRWNVPNETQAKEPLGPCFTLSCFPQLKVLPRDLQLCSETASGVDVGGQHEWGELVQLDPQTVGVIVRLERETFQVCVCCTQWWGLPSFLSLELLILGRWQIVVAKIHTALSGRSDSVSRGWLCGVGQVACHYPLCTCFIPCKMEISVSCISLKP